MAPSGGAPGALDPGHAGLFFSSPRRDPWFRAGQGIKILEVWDGKFRQVGTTSRKAQGQEAEGASPEVRAASHPQGRWPHEARQPPCHREDELRLSVRPRPRAPLHADSGPSCVLGMVSRARCVPFWVTCVKSTCRWTDGGDAGGPGALFWAAMLWEIVVGAGLRTTLHKCGSWRWKVSLALDRARQTWSVRCTARVERS